MKKMIALFLALAMVAPMLPVPIFADDSPQEQSSVEETVDTAEKHSDEIVSNDTEPTETETERKQDIPENDEVEGIQSENLYNEWTDEQLLEEYIRLTEAEDDDALNAFLEALSPEQQTVLMAMFTATVQDTPSTLEEEPLDKCGDNLTWSLNDNGVLTISGTGPMYNYEKDIAPWEAVYYSITRIVIEKGVTSIGNYAFSGFSNLSDIVIPDSVTQIGESAFRRCTKLKQVHIPESVTEIGYGAFYSSGLLSITIPGSVSRIQTSSFEFCSLEEIVIEEGVTYIDYAFRLNSPAKVYLPSSLKEISDDAFGSEKDTLFKLASNSEFQIYYSGTAEQWKKLTESHRFLSQLPVWIDGKPYEREFPIIGKCGENIQFTLTEDGILNLSGNGVMDNFYSIGPWESAKEYIKEVVISDKISCIGSHAFENCTNLERITISGSVVEIKYWAFENCSKLTDVYFGGTAEQWEQTAIDTTGNAPLFDANMHFSDTAYVREEFSGTCGNYAEWVLDSDLTLTISGMGLIYDYSSGSSAPWGKIANQVRHIVIEEGITYIGSKAFNACNNAISLTLPDSLEKFGSSVFSKSIPEVYVNSLETWMDIELTSTTGRRGTTSISPFGIEKLYIDGVLLTELVIPDGITEIKSGKFYAIQSLTAVTIPGSVKTVGQQAFASCSGLRSVTLLDGAGEISDNMFDHCTSLNSITIPDTVTRIGKSAFMDCGSLLQIHLPSSIQEIGNEAFYDSGLLRISIPGSVRTLGTNLFLHCEALSEIVVEDGVEKIGSDVFYGASIAKTYLPASLTYIADDAFGDGELFLKTVNYYNVPFYYAGSIEQWEALTASNNVMNQLPIWIDGTLYPGKHIHESQYPLEGSCGDNAHYSLDENGTIVISGTGAMWDFDADHPTPWSAYKDNIIQVIIEEGITEVGNHAFSMCAINDLQLADSITRIGAEAFDGGFYHTIKLTELKLPKSLKRIEEDAFFALNQLKTIFMFDQLDEICDGAFGDAFINAPLEKVIYSGTEEQWNAIKIGDNNLNLQTCTVYVSGGADTLLPKCSETVFYSISNGILTISGEGEVPDYDWDKPIAPWHDKGDSIHAVVVEEGITRFNMGAFYFYSADSITVTLPASLKSVDGCGVFMEQNSISKVIYCGTVDQWESISFGEDTRSIQNAPRIIQGIEYPQTGNCGSSISYTLTSDGTLSLSGIGRMEDYDATLTGSFSTAPWWPNCRAIKKVIIGDGITAIGDGAFGICENMTSISIPSTVESIGENAFLACDSLKEITIPENVRSLGREAFRGCGVTILHLPLSLERIESNCFMNASKIQKIFYPGNESQWNTISIAPWNSWLHLAEIIYNAVEEESCKHEQATHVEEQPSTCTEDGMQEHYECVSCGIWFIDGSIKDEIIDHNALIIPASGHSESIDEAVEATCTENGKTAGTHCSICGTVLITQEPIKATGHSFGEEWLNNANGHWHKCTSCNAESEIESHTPNITEATSNQNKECTTCGYVIQPMQAHRHTLKRVSAKSATCTEPGNKAYYICECGKTFDTSLLRREITDQSSIVTSALGHNWADASCTEPRHCKRNGCTAAEGEALGHIPSDWKHDLVSHWKSCTRSGCGKQLERADHIDQNKDQRCDICEYSWKNTTVLRSIAVNIVNIFRSIWR